MRKAEPETMEAAREAEQGSPTHSARHQRLYGICQESSSHARLCFDGRASDAVGCATKMHREYALSLAWVVRAQALPLPFSLIITTFSTSFMPTST